MNDILEKAANLLMYAGPKMEDLIRNALLAGNKYDIVKEEELIILSIHQTFAYGTEAIDKYYYNSSNELIKQSLYIRDKEKTIFDKYEETKALLQMFDEEIILVS